MVPPAPAAITAFFVFQPIGRDPLDSDLTLVYIGARIGLEHGWSHIYSLDRQHQLFAQGEVRPRPRSGRHRGGAPTSEAQPAQ